MKRLELVPILLLLGVGIIGVALGGLSADQRLDRYTAPVGEQVMVMLTLTNIGANSSQVTVTPSSVPGILIMNPDPKDLELGPKGRSMVNYPIMAEWSGEHFVTSEISYTEDSMEWELTVQTPFMAIESPAKPAPGAPASDQTSPSPLGDNVTPTASCP